MIGRSDSNGPQGSGINKDVSFTLNTADKHAVMCMSDGQANAKITHNMTATLNCMHEQPIVCMSSDTSNAAIDEDVAGTLHVGGGLPMIAAALSARGTTRDSATSTCRKGS